MGMMIIYLGVCLAIAGLVALTDHRRTATVFACAFYLVQGWLAVRILLLHIDQTDSLFFTFDSLGVLFFTLMSIVAPMVFYHSTNYLDQETSHEYKTFQVLLILLCLMITGVYFANNIAVTWIFLEATTLCSAGLIYHRRNVRSLEATWKYIFVCSTGIAIAYLGILLLSSIATNGDLSYSNLELLATGGNQLYLKIAFLFIFVGYSCKMEVFPLYTIGVDANTIAPTPVSALISTALVNAGFVSIFRVYKIMAQTPIFPWVCNVLIIAGIISLLLGTLYLRRTNHYKRFLAYSTVENMGIVLIGLGIGGIGVFAALLHLTAHTLIKSGLFLQVGLVGKLFGNYRINRIGNLINLSRVGAIAMIVAMILILAFPPSPLFISELLIFKEIILQGKWWLLGVIVLLLCVVIYSIGHHTLQMCYKPATLEKPLRRRSLLLPISVLAIFMIAIYIGVFQPAFLFDFLKNIAHLTL